MSADSLTPDRIEDFLKRTAQESWTLFAAEPLVYVLAPALALVLSVVTVGLMGPALLVGFFRMVACHRKGQHPVIGDIFSGMSAFLPATAVAVVILVAFLAGAQLLLLPGLLVGLFCMFTLHEIAHRDAGAYQAVVASIRLVREHLLHALLLSVTGAVLSLLGGMLVVGVLLTTPLILIGWTLAYEFLTESSEPS